MFNNYLSFQLKLANFLNDISIRWLLGIFILLPASFFILITVFVLTTAHLGMFEFKQTPFKVLGNLIRLIVMMLVSTGFIASFGVWIRVLKPSYSISPTLRKVTILFLLLGFFPVVGNLIKLGLGTREIGYFISGNFTFYCFIALLSALLIIGTLNFYVED